MLSRVVILGRCFHLRMPPAENNVHLIALFKGPSVAAVEWTLGKTCLHAEQIVER
jgi:hypothetical protein